MLQEYSRIGVLNVVFDHFCWAEASLDSISDNQLIQQTIAGNTSAFGALIERYQDRLVHSLEHAIGSREDALDAAQQAFVSGGRIWLRFGRMLHSIRGCTAWP